jgi:aryl-alcohol dehydrogenase-like predicted oxidoreductase
VKFRTLGTTGIAVSELGLGCSSLGASVFSSDEAGARRVLEAAFDAGINFFDTAATYAYGRSEALLGEAFGQRRDKVVIATKAGFLPSSLARYGRFMVPVLGKARALIAPYKRTLKGLSKRRQDFSPQHLRTSVEQSLRRLRSDYVDIFQLHCPPPEVLGRDDVFEALQALRAEGKIRFVGISAGSPAEARLAAGRAGVSTVQVPFNLLERDATTSVIPAAHVQGVALLARMPFARGVLTSYGHVRTGSHPVSGDHLARARARIGEVAAKLGSRPFLPEAALRFVLGQPQVASVIAGTTSVIHLRENIRALEAPRLSAGELQLVADMLADVPLRV